MTALEDRLSPIEQTTSEIGVQFSDVDSELTYLKPKVKELNDSGKTPAVVERGIALPADNEVSAALDELRSEIEELKARALSIQSEVASTKQAAKSAMEIASEVKAGRGESGRLESTVSDLRRELEAVRALYAELSEAVQHQCEDASG
jgi:chromosome segregation ATPase